MGGRLGSQCETETHLSQLMWWVIRLSLMDASEVSLDPEGARPCSSSQNRRLLEWRWWWWCFHFDCCPLPCAAHVVAPCLEPSSFVSVGLSNLPARHFDVKKLEYVLVCWCKTLNKTVLTKLLSYWNNKTTPRFVNDMQRSLVVQCSMLHGS